MMTICNMFLLMADSVYSVRLNQLVSGKTKQVILVFLKGKTLLSRRVAYPHHRKNLKEKLENA